MVFDRTNGDAVESAYVIKHSLSLYMDAVYID